MNLKEIKEMIALMNENELTELEIERDGVKIKLKKNSGQIQQIITSTATGAAKIQSESSAEELRQLKEQQLLEITSPMVGTFYRAPSPESPAFVDIGSDVAPDQVICIIEAMKLMNEIKSEVKGKIKEILVENGSAVEFGQVLFRVEPS